MHGENVIIFGADMNSSLHDDDEDKDALILGQGAALGLGDTTLAV